MRLTDLCIQRPVTAWVIFIAVMAIGLVGYHRIGVSQFPDVDIPTVSISVTWDGASAEAIESDVIQVLEDALAQVEGVERLSATARAGSGSLNLEFREGSDIDVAVQDVQNRIARNTRLLPNDLDPPQVGKMNPEDMPILWAAVSGTVDHKTLISTARTVRDRLRQVPGVGDVMTTGFRERALRVWLDPPRLEQHGLTALDVVSALRRQHLEQPAGRLEWGERPGRDTDIRVLGESWTLDQFQALVIGGTPQAPVTLGQVAVIEDGQNDQQTTAGVGGTPAIAMGVRKQYGSNQLAVAHGVRAALHEIRRDLPAGTALTVAYDATVFVERSVNALTHELLLAVLLTSLVCAWALRSFAAAVNVVLAIPMSLLGTVAVLHLCGFTLNTFTLLGLALVVGLVVDDAIMVQESIARERERGLDPAEAARQGTRSIAGAALASSLAVMAIFLPVTLATGVIGVFLLQFGLALSVAVGISYLEAVTLAPARAAQFMGRVVQPPERHHPTYRKSLDWCLQHPVTVLAMAAILTLGAFHVLRSLKGEFVPPEDQSRLQIRIDAPVGSNLAATAAIAAPIEQHLFAMPEVRTAVTIIGGFGGGNAANATIIVSLIPPDERTKSQAMIQDELRRMGRTVPGARVTVIDPSSQSFTGQRASAAIEYSVRGDSWSQVLATATRLQEVLTASGLATDIDSDHRVGRPELTITVDRPKAADRGVDIQAVTETLQILSGGVKAGKWSDDGRRFDLRVRSLTSDRLRPEDLGQYRVRSRSGTLIPLADLVTTELRPTVQSILRKDRTRAISISCNPASTSSMAEVQRLITEQQLPPGIRLVPEGSSRAMRESFQGLGLAFIGGLVAAYLLLAAQFNSFRQPVAILSIMPLALIGAALALWITGQSLNTYSVIGILLLMGIAKKNSILLVDAADQLKEEGHSLHQALLEAGPRRLRPILMTSAATVAAAMPTAFGLGEGGEMRQPMAIAIVGGVAVSTVLSLFVVPAFVLLLERPWGRVSPPNTRL